MNAVGVERHLNRLISAEKTPAAQYVVVNAGGVMFEHAVGAADLGTRAPPDTATTLMAYSMSKTIAAAAVIQLAEQGKIAIDAPAGRYVEGFPYGEAVTVRRLLAHTSGIPNPIPLRWVHPAATHAEF